MSSRTIKELVDKTFIMVENTEEGLIFFHEDGSSVVFYHSQYCCEDVRIVQITGDLDDLVDTPILVAEERVSDDQSLPPPENQYVDDSYTWTFYTFRTIKGTVDVQWFGESNGHYSEKVNIEEVSATEACHLVYGN